MGLQLLQLLAAVRSPGAANEHQYGCPTTEYVGEPNCMAVAGLQREWRCRIAHAEACYFLGHLSSSGRDTQRVCAPLPLIIIRSHWCRRQHSSGHRPPLPTAPECAMFVPSDVAVIGQTVLEKIDLVLDRTDQRLVPNSAHPDQRVSQVK
jgi:hypothetical protein